MDSEDRTFSVLPGSREIQRTDGAVQRGCALTKLHQQVTEWTMNDYTVQHIIGHLPPPSLPSPSRTSPPFNNVRRILVRGDQWPLAAWAKKILKIRLRNGAFWSAEKCSFCMFLLFNFSSIFQGVSWPHFPLCAPTYGLRLHGFDNLYSLVSTRTGSSEKE